MAEGLQAGTRASSLICTEATSPPSPASLDPFWRPHLHGSLSWLTFRKLSKTCSAHLVTRPRASAFFDGPSDRGLYAQLSVLLEGAWRPGRGMSHNTYPGQGPDPWGMRDEWVAKKSAHMISIVQSPGWFYRELLPRGQLDQNGPNLEDSGAKWECRW